MAVHVASYLGLLVASTRLARLLHRRLAPDPRQPRTLPSRLVAPVPATSPPCLRIAESPFSRERRAPYHLRRSTCPHALCCCDAVAADRMVEMVRVRIVLHLTSFRWARRAAAAAAAAAAGPRRHSGVATVVTQSFVKRGKIQVSEAKWRTVHTDSTGNSCSCSQSSVSWGSIGGDFTGPETETPAGESELRLLSACVGRTSHHTTQFGLDRHRSARVELRLTWLLVESRESSDESSSRDPTDTIVSNRFRRLKPCTRQPPTAAIAAASAAKSRSACSVPS